MPATRRKPAIRQPAPVADLDAVAEFAAGLSDAKLICRMNKRHIADPARTKVRPPTRHDPTHVMEGPCIICGQPVKRRFDEGYGRVRVTAAIGYDDDYLMPRGSGRIDANGQRMFVAEFMKRTTGAKKPRRRGRASTKVTPLFSEKNRA